MSDVQNAAQLPALRLKRNEDRRLHAGHLWIFSNEIDTDQTPLRKFQPGDLARVLAANDKALGIAYVNAGSLISARMLQTWTLPDADWFLERMQRALALRERLYTEPFYRLVYGESDGLPGLVVDRYGDTVVVQIGTAGMERLKPAIEAALKRLVRCSVLLWKNDSAARELEGLPVYMETAFGTLSDLTVTREDGLEFQVGLAAGQKTGWFFDQATNRRALGRYIRPGARLADVFSYVGGWAVHGLKAGAAEALCIDSSSAALEAAQANARRNGVKLDVAKGDAFEVLERLVREKQRFDVVVLDPPAFAKRKRELPKAIAAYRRLNQLGMQLLGNDGILVSCSCSHHLSAADLEDAIAKAGRGAGRQVQILEARGAAPDHPVHPAIDETRYLKAYFCRVSDGLK